MQNGEREMRCSVRRAEQAEMQAVLAFAAQIFADEQQIPREMNVIPAEKQPQWFCMEQDGVLAGTAAVYREGGRWHMGRITVAPSLRGQHRGTFLMKSVLTEVFAQGVDEIFLEARDATVHILRGFGAQIAGRQRLFLEAHAEAGLGHWHLQCFFRCGQRHGLRRPKASHTLCRAGLRQAMALAGG